MGELGGFLKIHRSGIPYRDPQERVGDFQEFVVQRSDEEVGAQGARCMECGVPFCHNGCPLGNLIPDWNDLVYHQRWHDAIRQLHATNNFPEFTGRLCPAPCEASCVLEINEGEAVTIKQIELSIVARAWDEGWIVAEPPAERTGHTVAVVVCTGSRVPRDLPVPGRELDGVHFAMEYLYTRNRAVAGTHVPRISAMGKHVVVIGGGDTRA